MIRLNDWRIAMVGSIVCTGAACHSPARLQDGGTNRIYLVEDFNLDAPGDAWTARTAELWSIVEEAGNRFLQMKAPPGQPMMDGVRRPQEYIVYHAHELRSFNLSCRVRIDNDPGVRGRDACIIFGRQDSTHMYYVHLSNVSNDYHNTLVRVDGETRRPLTPTDPNRPPAISDRMWHRVNIIRDCDSGLIRVYVDPRDENAEPLFEVHDRTYEWGHVALGSFNDHASFDYLQIEGQIR